MNMKTNPPNWNYKNIAPERIAQLLSRAAQQLDDRTASALRRARNIALERQSLSSPVFALSTKHGSHWSMSHAAQQFGATITLLIAMLFGGLNYLHHAQENDLSQLDIAILTDELPLEVFVE